MRKLPCIKYLKSSQAAFTLLELLVVLAIIASAMGLAIYGVLKFRQVILVSNTTKELVLEMRKARRYAIDNVITSTGAPTEGYYIFIDGDGVYYWGECTEDGCSHAKRVKSQQYSGIKVSSCGDYSIVKFNCVTGEFVITNNETETTSTPNTTCIIEVGAGGGLVNTKREIEVSGESRTIKII
jgi:prepilin-type N-terminal cleavage/methylation domain-containing protein